MQSRTESVILGLLQLGGIIGVCYGMWYQYVAKMSLTGIFYCTPWYALTGISHVLGLTAIFLDFVEDELKGNSQLVLQYHYMTAWLAVIIGYPAMVTYAWLSYYYSIVDQIHLALAVVPLIAWVGQSSEAIVTTTQICVSIACVSHGYICFLATDVMGMMCAALMAFNVCSLSVPTRYHIWEFTSREMFILGLIITSYMMNLSISYMGMHSNAVKSINPLR